MSQAHAGSAPRWRPTFRGRRLRRLQARLLIWFLGAIVLAIGASILTTVLTASDNDTPTRVVSKHVQQQPREDWDDPVGHRELRRRAPRDDGPRHARSARRQPLHRVAAARRHGDDLRGRRRLRPGDEGRRDGRRARAPYRLARSAAVAGRCRARCRAPRARRGARVASRSASRDRSSTSRRPRSASARAISRRAPASTACRVAGSPKRCATSVVAFDGMADRIARVVLEQRELLAAISHELRSPLGRARIAVEIARERPEPGRCARRRGAPARRDRRHPRRSPGVGARGPRRRARRGGGRARPGCARASPSRKPGSDRAHGRSGRRVGPRRDRRGAPRSRPPQPLRECLEPRPPEGRRRSR